MPKLKNGNEYDGWVAIWDKWPDGMPCTPGDMVHTFGRTRAEVKEPWPCLDNHIRLVPVKLVEVCRD